MSKSRIQRHLETKHPEFQYLNNEGDHGGDHEGDNGGDHEGDHGGDHGGDHEGDHGGDHEGDHMELQAHIIELEIVKEKIGCRKCKKRIEKRELKKHCKKESKLLFSSKKKKKRDHGGDHED